MPVTLNKTATIIIQGILLAKYASNLYPPHITNKLNATTSKAIDESRLGLKSGSTLGLEEGGLFFFSNFDFTGFYTHFTTPIKHRS